MLTPEAVPGESKTRPNHTFLAFLFLVFVMSSLLLISLLKNPRLDLGRFVSKVALDKNRIQISAKELDEAYALEKFLNFPDVDLVKNPIPLSASVSNLPKGVKLPNLAEILKNTAKERVVKRKILEKETPRLKVDLVSVKTEAARMPKSTTNSGRAVPSDLVAIFSYDETLIKKVREQVEGFVEKQVLSVVFSPPNSTASAQKVANDILPLMQKGTFDSQNYLKDHTLDSGLSLFNQIIRDPLKAYPDPVKLPTVGRVKIEPTPFSYDIVKINKIEKGLGMSFEEWFQTVSKKYQTVNL